MPAMSDREARARNAQGYLEVAEEYERNARAQDATWGKDSCAGHLDRQVAQYWRDRAKREVR